MGGGTWLHFHNIDISRSTILYHLQMRNYAHPWGERTLLFDPSFTRCAAHYESVFLLHPVIASFLEWLCSVCLKSAILRKVNHFKCHNVCNLLVEF